MKREYRGQRSLEAITDYVRELLRDPVKELETTNDIDNVDVSIYLFMFESSLINSMLIVNKILHYFLFIVFYGLHFYAFDIWCF